VTVLIVSLLLTSPFLTTGFSYAHWKYEPWQSDTAASSLDFPLKDAKGHWAEYAIAEMYAKGVMKGYEDNTFRPNKPVTFLEAVVMLEKLLWREPTESDIDAFSYLEMNFNIPKWAVGYVGLALRQELLSYGELGKVSLQQPLVRQDAAVLAVRALDLTKQAQKINEAPPPFTDSAQINDSVAGYVFLACERKVMNGFPDGSFRPVNPISRAETAVLLSKVANQLPFINSEEKSGFIKSINQSRNSLTLVNDANRETEIILPEKTLIYLNDKPAAIEQLAAEVHVRIIGTGTGDFTVLIGHNIIPDNGAEVVMEPVNLSTAPLEIQQWVEINKIYENYLAGIFNENLYFLASRGEKKRSGYTVDILKVSTTTDAKGIHYKIWVDRSDPARDAVTTPSINYPYALVRVELPPEKINSVTFVDKLNQVIAETEGNVP